MKGSKCCDFTLLVFLPPQLEKFIIGKEVNGHVTRAIRFFSGVLTAAETLNWGGGLYT